MLIYKIGAISASDAQQVKSIWSVQVKPAF